jgi:hypothetical protein
MQVEEEGPVDYEKIVAEILESKPWENLVATKSSKAEDLVSVQKGNFDKFH